MPNWKNFWINLQSFQVHGAGVSAPFLALGLTELARAMVTPHCQIRQLFTTSPCPNLWHMDSCRHAFPEPLPGVPLSTLLCPLFLGIWHLFHNPFSCVSLDATGPWVSPQSPLALNATAPTFRNAPAFLVSGLTGLPSFCLDKRVRDSRMAAQHWYL